MTLPVHIVGVTNINEPGIRHASQPSPLSRLASSHSSTGSQSRQRRPSPQVATTQSDLHFAVSLLLLPSSHCSPGSTLPLPHTGVSVCAVASVVSELLLLLVVGAIVVPGSVGLVVSLLASVLASLLVVLVPVSGPVVVTATVVLVSPLVLVANTLPVGEKQLAQVSDSDTALPGRHRRRRLMGPDGAWGGRASVLHAGVRAICAEA